MSLLDNKIKKTSYRPDIDGLRAVAVVSVILYHINETILPGGFVGVDIFFVISGYLITLHIMRDMEAGKFSLVEFYRRRIKRIIPVMLIVVAVVLLASLVILRPEDTRKLAQSSVASLLSMANVYFWLFQDSSYFAPASNELPLLHLWSLGVEEQFYIFWPLILMLIYKLVRGTTFVVIFTVAAIISFLLGEVLFERAPSFVYYMLPTRFGELLVGALSAYIVARRGERVISQYIIQSAAITGLILVGASLSLLSAEMVFPGMRAVPPTIGAALLILAGHYGNNIPSRLLMFRPMVLMGLISYSAYLWHWPLLAFIRYSNIEIHFFTGLLIFGLTVLLAWITYQLVERPTRKYNGTAIRVFLFQFAIPASALIIFSIIIIKTDGYFLHWNSDAYREAQNRTLPAYKYDYVCQKWEITDKDLSSSQCVIGKIENTLDLQPSVLLWGDSNAAHYIGIMGEFAREGRYQFRNLEHSSCPPINSDPTAFINTKRLENCQNSLHTITSSFDMFDVYIISAAWDGYLSRSDNFLDLFFNTATELASQDKLVILLGKVPPIKGYDRLCKEKTINLSFMECAHASTALLPKHIATINSRLKQFAALTKHVEYFDVTKYLCPDGLCSAYDKNGKALYFDSSHLALPASWQIGSEIIHQEKGLPFPFTLIPDWLNSTKVKQVKKSAPPV